MSLPIPPPPATSAVVKQRGLISEEWYRWQETEIRQRLEKAPAVQADPARLLNQNASLPLTTVYTTVVQGRYRISAYVRVTTPDGAASSIALTVRWTDGGVAQTKILIPALVGDTTATSDGESLPIEADAGSQIRYSTTYSSTTPAKMKYTASVVVEQLP